MIDKYTLFFIGYLVALTLVGVVFIDTYMKKTEAVSSIDKAKIIILKETDNVGSGTN